VIITDVTAGKDARGAVLSASVRPETHGLAPFRLEFVVRDEAEVDLALSAEPFLACALSPAMALGEDVRVDGPVSARLLASLPTIQAIYHRWDTALRVVDVQAGTSKAPRPAPGRALFFSGGVDSWYSLLKHRREGTGDAHEALTHLILVFGFDVRRDNPELFDKIASGVRRVAEATDLRLTIVETNVRQFSDQLMSWGFYHGGAMAAVGLTQSTLVGRCLIASSYAYDELHPWGSHPLLDPLWSTESVDFIHDGCEAVRSQKVKVIARSALALATLRVCWANWQTEYNCGRCEKCLRTMLALHVAGALDRCSTFKRPLTASAVMRMSLEDSSEIFLRDLIRELAATGRDRGLVRAIEFALRRRRWRTSAGRFVRQRIHERATLGGLRALITSGVRPRRMTTS